MRVGGWERAGQLRELFRYYRAGIINTAFGFSVYSLLVWLGLNLYLAQVLAQILGATFNYFNYSRHVFRDRRASKVRFGLAYLMNYIISLTLLACFDLFVTSPYVTGFLATITASIINYFALRHVVFVKHRLSS